MNSHYRIVLCLTAALATAACSTKPRNFSAAVMPIADRGEVEVSEADAFGLCNSLVRKGVKGNFAANAATGVAGAAGGFGAAALSTTVTYGSLSTAGAAAAAAIPIVGFAAAFGVNRAIRAGRERKYKKTMTSCMDEFGYTVVDWTRIKKKQPATAVLRAAPEAPRSGDAATIQTAARVD